MKIYNNIDPSIPINTEAEAALFTQLQKSQHVLILGHKGPDGDSVGSSLAMHYYLMAIGVKSTIVMDGSFPYTLKNIEGLDHIISIHMDNVPEGLQQLIDNTDTVLCLDFNKLSRTGKTLTSLLQESFSKHRRPVLCIDHHTYPQDEDFDILISVPQASATCHILALLLIERISSFPPKTQQIIATQLLWGIITDTGRFNHASGNPALFEVVANLMRLGAQKDLIVNETFHSHPVSRLRLEGYIMEHMVIREDLGVAYFSLTLDELKHFGVTPADTEGLVNKPLDIASIKCSAFFRESREEGIKISMRSKGDFAVNAICSTCYGGGGHINAAGGELASGNMEEAISLFLQGVTSFAEKGK